MSRKANSVATKIQGMQVQPLVHVTEDDDNDHHPAGVVQGGELRHRRLPKRKRIPPIDIRQASPIQNIFTQTITNEQTRDLRSKTHRQTPGYRTVSLFWQEKFKTIIDTFQILGLLWTAYGAWPASWIVATQWTSLLAGDVLSLTEYYSSTFDSLVLPTTWSENKTSYLALYLPAVCIVLPLLLWAAWMCSHSSSSIRRVVRIAEFFYLPICVCLFELATCRGRVDHWWSTPTAALSCWGWFGTTDTWYSYLYVYAIPVLSLLVGVTFLISIPVILAHHILMVNVYHSPVVHECYVNSKELEYLLYINTDYEDEQFETTASFKRHALHQRQRILMLKIILTLTRVVMNGWNLYTWSMLVFGSILLLWAILQTLSPPYRVWSR